MPKSILFIFSHLLERLTLLIIITFGETIIGIADYFKPSDFSINSIFIFIAIYEKIDFRLYYCS
ncbi:low temperature requirement protein A [Lactobacillus intestinalis]|uniref:low temperature requirement protein A n=1 Tax=Lactobacillus intestinalis TaxID=151781 RepID=UPI00350E3C80